MTTCNMLPCCKKDPEKAQKSDRGESSRGNWSNKAEFLLSMIGYAVGLGNVWRFPYLAFEDGGGAFLIPYLIMLFVAGLPIFYLEVSLGQFCSQGPIGSFNCVPIVKGLGLAMVVISIYVGVYYNVVITYTLYYLFSSFTSDLPWDGCAHWWNTPRCMDMMTSRNASCFNVSEVLNQSETTTSPYFTNVTTVTPVQNLTLNNTCGPRVSPSEDFWKYRVLQISDGIDNPGKIRWELILVLFLAWAIVFGCLIKGVKSSGKAVYFTATFPYIVLSILLVRGLTLDGASEGIRYFFEPKWEKLLTAKVWKDAATQIFYSLSASWGGIITLSSYNKFNNNCYRDSLIVVFTNSFTSIFAGVTIFAVIGYMAHVLGTDVKEVAAEGPGLAFVIYPEAISKMPLAPFWSILFFLMLLTLGLGTMFATLETIVTSLTDAFPAQLRHRKSLLTLCVCFVLFLLGIPMVTQGGFYFLHLLDSYAASYTLIVCAVVEMVAISHIYGLQRFCDDIKMMTGYYPNMYWRVTWSFLSPAILTGIFFYSLASYKPLVLDKYDFPTWANVIGWLTMISSAGLIPATAIYQIMQHKGTLFERVRAACRPESTWGPYLSVNRTGRYSSSGKHDVTVTSNVRLLSETSTTKNTHTDGTKILLEDVEIKPS
uniref:Sodium- and chloride-dependent glycine transporter 2 n=1 Tax=Phallusia mammillata TaxID=59560 RepID=A0A6F9DTH9_9ASCI|nr:sodium- and chloride-dependent glycine transporter 2 [Phallusia mammillata]